MAEFRPGLWIRNTVIAGVILAFVAFFGMPSGSPGPNRVARVGSETISRDVFEFFRSQNENLSRSLLPPNLNASQVRELLDRQTLDGLVRRYVLAQQARELGLEVTDGEVRDEIRGDTSFLVNGRFDRDQLERLANQLGSMREYTEEVRRDILLRKLQRAVASPQRVSEADAQRWAREELTRVSLRYARASSSRFAEPGELDADEVRVFADDQVTRVEALYLSRSHEFQTEEEVRARHILFSGDTATSSAQAALERLRGGESFEAVARELSTDAATREAGGDLGFFPRGRVLPALEEAAFGLGAGEIAGPITTERGVHLVVVEEHREAQTRALEEVRFELARELMAADRRRGRAREAAESFLDDLAADLAFDEAARRLGLQVESTAPFSGSDPLPSDLAQIPGIRGAVFGLSEELPRISRVLESGDDYYVVWLERRIEPKDDEVEDQATRIRERLEDEARGRVLTLWYRHALTELQRGGEIELYPLYPTG